VPPRFDQVRHREWQANISDWTVAWDVYRGGRHVLRPGRSVGRFRFLRQTSEAGVTTPAEAARTQTPFDFAANTFSYLQPFVRETPNEFSDRASRAVHYPVFRHVSDIYVTATLRTPPKRGDGTAKPEPWQSYWRDVDLAGTNVDPFWSTALTTALVYGKALVVTDKPRFPTEATTRAEQLDRGERAYSYIVAPTQLVDWLLDRNGRFIWAVLREDMPEERSPGEDQPDRACRYRVWHPDRWELFEAVTVDGVAHSQSEWKLVATGAHSVGEVPIAVLYARRGYESRRTLESDGVLSDLVDIDRAIFNHLSELFSQMTAQAFGQLFLPVDDASQVPNIETGVHRYVGYHAEFGQPLMLGPDAAVLKFKESFIASMIAIARQLSNVSRGRAEFSKEERSAATLSLESQDKNNVVASLAAQTEEADRSTAKHVAAYEGVAEDAIPQAHYSRDVSLKALQQQLNDATSLDKLSVPIDAMVELLKPLYVRAMREAGQDHDAIERGLKAFEGMKEVARVEAVAA